MRKRTGTTQKDGVYQSKLNEEVTQKDQVLYNKSGSSHQFNFWHCLHYTAPCKSHVNYSLKSYHRVKKSRSSSHQTDSSSAGKQHSGKEPPSFHPRSLSKDERDILLHVEELGNSRGSCVTQESTESGL